MSSPRLAILALGLPLLTGACAGAALTAVSYGADGVSYVETGKSTTDHFASMVSKKDCAFWRLVRNQRICREREGDHDPYQVNYDTAERQPSEDGVSYAPPLHAAPDAPAASWTAEAYKPTPVPVTASASPPEPAEPAAAPAEVTPPPPPMAAKPVGAHKSVKKKTRAAAKAVKKASPHQAAAVP
jgi:hypothetical protein